MNYRRLGRTGLMVSEVGFGGEWLERHDEAHSVNLIRHAHERGVNIIDCWMPDPKSRDIIGKGIADCRGEWFVQGHVGSTWQGGQYVRSRDLAFVRPAFEDLLRRIGGGYIDLGMIHYVDSEADWQAAMESPFLDYVLKLRDDGLIRHIGMSTHNPRMAVRAVEAGLIEMLLFSVNPAFDMHPATEDLMELLQGKFGADERGIDEERAALYRLCEERDVGITVMKGFFGGALLDEKRSPFGVAFTPAQLIHYALTRPGVASILCGYDTVDQIDAAVAYETADADARDYASVLARAPMHGYTGLCTYCGHCQPCPMGIDIAAVNKLYDLAVRQETVPQSLRAHYRDLPRNAADCVGCKSCEPNCPFGVNIAERMAKAAELFG